LSFPRAPGGNPINNTLIILRILMIGSPTKAFKDDRMRFSEDSGY